MPEFHVYCSSAEWIFFASRNSKILAETFNCIDENKLIDCIDIYIILSNYVMHLQMCMIVYYMSNINPTLFLLIDEVAG